MFKGWVKKDGVNANLVLCDKPNLRYPMDVSFSPLNTNRGYKYARFLEVFVSWERYVVVRP